MSPGLALPHVVIAELVMLGPDRLPVSAHYSTVGQWGTLVGVFIAGCGSSLILFLNARNVRNVEETETTLDRRQRHGRLPNVNSQTPPILGEGAWVGQHAEGQTVLSGGKAFIVENGLLKSIVNASAPGGTIDGEGAGSSANVTTQMDVISEGIKLQGEEEDKIYATSLTEIRDIEDDRGIRRRMTQ
jgi:hypothetical protein